MVHTCGKSVLSAAKTLLGAVVLMVALPMAAPHAYTIDFVTLNQTGPDGNVAYLGGATPMFSGSTGVPAIDVDFIFAPDSPLNSGLANQVACVACTLSFATGNRLPVPGLVFDGGGTIFITGMVPDVGITTTQVLMAGSFSGAVAIFNATSGVVSGFTAASLLDFKNPVLASFFGVPGGLSNIWTGNMAIGLTGFEDAATNAFAAGIADLAPGSGIGGVIQNAIPAPGTLLLVALGLLGVGVGRAASLGRMSIA